MHCHPDATTTVVRRAIGAYLKMAPYRQGGAGKGASLRDGTSCLTPLSDGDEADC